MNDKYIMSLDQGTTSSRCIIYDRKGNIIGKSQQEFPQIFPETGWVEHDPMAIWTSQLAVARSALKGAGLSAGDIAAVGITNQRETTVVWDRDTGKPVYNAIVWQCRRTADLCNELKDEGLEEDWRGRTGLPIDPYFSATKLRWILENVEGARERAEAGQLLFGTIDTWLIWNLTGGRVHATDYSNASRTMMYNIRDLCWDREILAELGIPEGMLPKVLPSSGDFGETDPEIFGKPLSIGGVVGDQQAALFGQTCFEKGAAKNTFGTGGFMLVNTGEKPVFSQNGLLTTIAWGQGGQVTYALEGSVFVSGATMQWLRDGLGLIADAAESEEICKSVPDTAGVYLVPAFVGLGAPYWDPYARGVMVGLTRGTGRAHVIRAAVESMAYQTCDLMAAMKKDLGEELSALRVDGGAARDSFLLQFQADMSGRDVIRPVCIETTSLGAAYLAGLAVGYWKDLSDILGDWQADRTFRPSADEETRQRRLSQWHRAVERSRSWIRPE